jgi:amidohydrolase
MTPKDFLAEAEAMRDELVARRRDFHQHPELAFQEVRTASIVADELAKLGLEVQRGVGRTGVVAMLEGSTNGPTVLVRADMDALPILEEIDKDYVSVNTGVMHACGHDGHTAIALGVAKLLSGKRDRLKGRVKFVFQPAEEIAGGAVAMKEDGVLENPRPDVTLGLHLWNNMPVGTFGVADGPVMAGSGDFEVTITGKGGHGASPHLAHDPVVCAAQIVTAFQTIVSRSLNPIDTAVISVTRISAGTANNIIPSSATMSGTIRFFRAEVAEMLRRRMTEVVEGVCAALGCQGSINVKLMTEPVSNHPEPAERVRSVIAGLGYGEDALYNERTMGAEDVGVMMKDIPGMFLFLGSGNEAKGLNYPHHHPLFDFDDEAALPLGVAVLSAAVAEYVMDR